MDTERNCLVAAIIDAERTPRRLDDANLADLERVLLALAAAAAGDDPTAR